MRTETAKDLASIEILRYPRTQHLEALASRIRTARPSKVFWDSRVSTFSSKKKSMEPIVQRLSQRVLNCFCSLVVTTFKVALERSSSR